MLVGLIVACAQYRASIQFSNAHSDGIWTTFWTSNDKILTGSVDEVAKAWCVGLRFRCILSEEMMILILLVMLLNLLVTLGT